MKILVSVEFFEFYRGDKDFVVSKILAQKYNYKFVYIAPSRLSYTDSRFLEKKYFSELLVNKYIGKLPDSIQIKKLKSFRLYKTIFPFGKKLPTQYFQIIPGYINTVKEEKPDLILESNFTVLTPRSYMTYIGSILYGIPVVYLDCGDYGRNLFSHKLLSIFERPVVNNVKKIITYTYFGKKRFIEKYALPSEKIIILPKPIQVEEFEVNVGDVNYIDYRKRLDLENKFVVGYYGRITKYKNVSVFFKVAASFKNSRDIVFVCFGDYGTEHDREYFENLIKREGIRNIKIAGFIPHNEMKYAYRASDLIIFPSLVTPPGFSTVLAEAASSGCALILGIKGYERVVPFRHGKEVFVVDPNDVRDYKDAIVFLKNNDEFRNGLKKVIKKFVMENMSVDVIAEKYDKIFKEILEKYSKRKLRNGEIACKCF